MNEDMKSLDNFEKKIDIWIECMEIYKIFDLYMYLHSMNKKFIQMTEIR